MYTIAGMIVLILSWQAGHILSGSAQQGFTQVLCYHCYDKFKEGKYWSYTMHMLCKHDEGHDCMTIECKTCLRFWKARGCKHFIYTLFSLFEIVRKLYSCIISLLSLVGCAYFIKKARDAIFTSFRLHSLFFKKL